MYGTAILEHFHVSVLGSSDADALMNWLKANDYYVSSISRDVLEAYIKDHWSFVAVKLSLQNKSTHRNQYLPTIDNYVSLRRGSISVKNIVGKH